MSDGNSEKSPQDKIALQANKELLFHEYIDGVLLVGEAGGRECQSVLCDSIMIAAATHIDFLILSLQMLSLAKRKWTCRSNRGNPVSLTGQASLHS